MFEVQYLFGGNIVYSPWMSRGGDNLLATVNMILNSNGTYGIEVEVYQKDSEDTGDGDPYPNGTTPLQIALTGSPAQGSATFTGLKELVRYRFKATGSGTDRVLFRMLAPVWFDDVRVGS